MSFCLVIRFGSALFVCVYCAFLFVYISYMYVYIYFFYVFVGFVSSCSSYSVLTSIYSVYVCLCVCIKCVACFTLCSSLVVVVHVMLLIFMSCPFFAAAAAYNICTLMFSMLVDNGRRLLRQSAAIDDVEYTTWMPIMFDLQLKLFKSRSLSPLHCKFMMKLQITKLNKALKISWPQTE